MESNKNSVDSQQPTTEQSKVYEIARKAGLATLGLGVITVEAITTLVERLVARAEEARAEARARSDALQPSAAENPAPTADVNILQSRVEQLKTELESLRTRQAPEEGAQG